MKHDANQILLAGFLLSLPGVGPGCTGSLARSESVAMG